MPPAGRGRGGWLRPSSLRGRLALLFALGTGSLLLLSAAFLYVSFDRELKVAIDDGLASRADDIAADARAGSAHIRRQEAFAQLVDANGAVIDSSSTIAADRQVLTREELAQARTHEIVVQRPVPGLADRARLLARPLQLGNRSVVIVVGASLEAVERARHRLAFVLGVGSPLMVGVLAAGGWVLTTAAMRPVGRMAQEADRFSLSQPGRRLPQPDGDDELAQLGRTLNAMLERIEASFAHERAFVDDASHELRTPLSILRSELELALDVPGTPAEVDAALRSALDEAERLGRLADDLLVLARAGAGTLPLRRESVDVTALARHVGARFGDPVEVDVTGPAVVASVDRVRTEQVLTNLVSNARRFASSRVQVEVSDDGEGGAVVRVADDGAGFPENFLGTAFDRFTRADAVRGRDTGGAGIGLSIVATIAAAHGGWARALNGPPLGGAVVEVHLPAQPR